MLRYILGHDATNLPNHVRFKPTSTSLAATGEPQAELLNYSTLKYLAVELRIMSRFSSHVEDLLHSYKLNACARC